MEFQQLTLSEVSGLDTRRPRGSMWDEPVAAALKLKVGEAIFVPMGADGKAPRAKEALLAYLKRSGRSGLLAVRVGWRPAVGEDGQERKTFGLVLSLHETEYGPDQAQQPELSGSSSSEPAGRRSGRDRKPATSAS